MVGRIQRSGEGTGIAVNVRCHRAVSLNLESTVEDNMVGSADEVECEAVAGTVVACFGVANRKQVWNAMTALITVTP